MRLIPAVLLAAWCACTSAHRGEPFAPQPELNAQQSRGERVFFESCNSCHPHGEGGLGPALHNKPLPSPMIRLQVRKGMGAMPAFPVEKISSADLDALLAYLLEMQTPSE